MLVTEEALVWGTDGKSLYLPLKFAVNLNCSPKNNNNNNLKNFLEE